MYSLEIITIYSAVTGIAWLAAINILLYKLTRRNISSKLNGLEFYKKYCTRKNRKFSELTIEEVAADITSEELDVINKIGRQIRLIWLFGSLALVALFIVVTFGQKMK